MRLFVLQYLERKINGISSYVSSNSYCQVIVSMIKTKYIIRCFHYCHLTVLLIMDKHLFPWEAASFISWMVPPDQRFTGKVLIGRAKIKRSPLWWCPIWGTFSGSAVTASVGATNKPLTRSLMRSGKRIKNPKPKPENCDRATQSLPWFLTTADQLPVLISF